MPLVSFDTPWKQTKPLMQKWHKFNQYGHKYSLLLLNKSQKLWVIRFIKILNYDLNFKLLINLLKVQINILNYKYRSNHLYIKNVISKLKI